MKMRITLSGTVMTKITKDNHEDQDHDDSHDDEDEDEDHPARDRFRRNK